MQSAQTGRYLPLPRPYVVTWYPFQRPTQTRRFRTHADAAQFAQGQLAHTVSWQITTEGGK